MHGDAAVNRGGAGYVDASVGIPARGQRIAVGPRCSRWACARPRQSALLARSGQCGDHQRRNRRGRYSVAPKWRKKSSPTATVFSSRLKASLADGKQLLAPHRAARLIAYHNTWPYFARRFRLNVVDVIEIKEGVTPSPARLARLAAIMREQKIRVIVHEPFEPERPRNCWPGGPARRREARAFGRQPARRPPIPGRSSIIMSVRWRRRYRPHRTERSWWRTFSHSRRCRSRRHRLHRDPHLVRSPGLRRNVVFADLALAQMSALGATVAVVAGHAVQSPAGYAYALVSPRSAPCC